MTSNPNFIEINAIKWPAYAWPLTEAKRIFDYIQGTTPKKGYVLFETGYGPSGLPHIGTFAEVTRTTMVRLAFQQICDIPTKLVCFSDDMDGLRKVPSNVPNQGLIAQHIGKALTSIPDPFGEKESYGHYMNAKLCSFLDQFGFEYDFYSATKCYQSGRFNHMMVMCLERYDQIMELMLPTFRQQRQSTYSPFMPVCPETGVILQVPIEKINVDKQSIAYRNNRGELIEVPVTDGHCKLQWKPDFGMRWACLDVDYEMYGKDHQPNAAIYSKICTILDGKPPVQLFYELFLDEEGGKISKSKGNSISVDQWLHYAPIESIGLFMYQSPIKAKRLHFEVIPKSMDEYLTLNKQYHQETELLKKMTNPVFHIHQGNVPKIDTFGISFSLLLNLASVCNPEDKSILWGFISKYSPQARKETAPYLDKMTDCAINYYNDFIRNNKTYLEPTPAHKQILTEIADILSNISAEASAEEVQRLIYDVGMKANYANLRDYFKELYQILLGQTEGPRLGSFIKLYGVEHSIDLIKEKTR